jgi:hypothetical protein
MSDRMFVFLMLLIFNSCNTVDNQEKRERVNVEQYETKSAVFQEVAKDYIRKSEKENYSVVKINFLNEASLGGCDTVYVHYILNRSEMVSPPPSFIMREGERLIIIYTGVEYDIELPAEYLNYIHEVSKAELFDNVSESEDMVLPITYNPPILKYTLCNGEVELIEE